MQFQMTLAIMQMLDFEGKAFHVNLITKYLTDSIKAKLGLLKLNGVL